MDHFDVIIVGAGLSGIGAACHLSRDCPGKTYTILEARAQIGGTWDLFRYPGVRSDSDMHTLGYNFKPWRDAKAIADGPAILSYVKEAAKEYDVERHIRFNQKLVKSEWDTKTARWTLTTEHAESGKQSQFSCNFIISCAGYYDYKQPYTPEFKGQEDFEGEIIHPQLWPDDLDYTEKKMVIVGSGATAITLLPQLAKKAAHVIQLQRSPTYVASLPSKDRIANGLRKILPEKLAYRLTRWKNISFSKFVYKQAQKNPDKVKKNLRKAIVKSLGPDYPVDVHFNPHYNPWDQRLCLMPDDDVFTALKSGKAEIVTDQIDHFTKTGIQLASGAHLDTDIIITATGLNLIVFGGVETLVDGKPFVIHDSFGYKGMMFSGLPNMVSVFGYTNASWTLRADLISQFACRLINHMEAKEKKIALPTAPEGLTPGPWLKDFDPGYITRRSGDLPRQGDIDPWQNIQDYSIDKIAMGKSVIEDGHLILS
jgi:cation diffusion facilitator CzcD-associated flavoprotein CzcO